MRRLYAGEIFDLTSEQFFRSQCYLLKQEAHPKKYAYDELTEEEKNDIIEVDGHRHIRKLYEAR